ncbi:putative homoserine dehydrogenase-like protein [Sinobaca qinghaiensis]|uniref:Putative homoserine dehydrogenase-like protein n=1 Tax=Sinobaca qinghaiensis TaxID=342944 RepID=A0A419V808_9BACL|nr:NAD(P)-dependent oxidoreductase [Sinobaca qinghaiensis]RKD76192.1 putative homoserine dehydrogenase-like protein [Sinobaca qinghaiensis]
MLGTNRKLIELEKQGKSIRVGLVGAGQMGRGMIAQIEKMKGMKVVITADIAVENVVKAYENAGIKKADLVVTDNKSKAAEAVRSGFVVATADASLVSGLADVDVVVDATGVPNVGAEIAWKSITNKKHIVMLNVEADITVGPILKQMADAAGVVYTGSAGDEPGAIMELFDFSEALGFETVALGKGKNNPLNVEANPDTAAQEAAEKKSSPKMLASFQDGTKTMVEMNAVANATGFLPDKPGMHGLKGEVKDLPAFFETKENGGKVSKEKVVEYINGIAPGVFAIIRSEQEEVNAELTYLKMGDGPNYVLYRPYHLTSLETPLSIAKAYLDHVPTIAPYKGRIAETATVAKKDLAEGDYLDSIGGFTVYGTILTAEDSDAMEALPIGLVDRHIKMRKAVKKGEIIRMSDIIHERDTTIWKLRELQNTFGTVSAEDSGIIKEAPVV